MSKVVAACDVGRGTVTQVGRLLRDRRMSLGLTQEQVEELSGVPQNTQSKIEAGLTLHPRMETLLRLGAVLDLSTNDFYRAMGWVVEEVTTGEEVSLPDYGPVPADSVRWVAMQDRGETVEVPKSWISAARSPLFVVHASGNCLAQRGIHDGDVVVLESRDDERPVSSGAIVLARVGSEYSLKVLERIGLRIQLCDGNGHVVYALQEDDDVHILGTYYMRFSAPVAEE